MFGMEEDSKQPFRFLLEQECEDYDFWQAKMDMVQERLSTVKGQLKEGSTQEVIDAAGAMVQGYVALHTVLTRIKPGTQS